MRSFLVLVLASTLTLGTACSADPDAAVAGAEDDLTSADRRAILEALRTEVKPTLANQDIVFNVSQGSLRVEGGHAWLMGKVELRGGGEPKTDGTDFEEAAREGFFDGFHIEALLAKKEGRWVVLEHGIGSTDVWWEGIEERHPGAPRSIFPHLDGASASPIAQADRAAVMDALRARVKPDLAGQDVVFNVKNGSLRIASDFCWLVGKVELRGGGEPKTAGTAFEEAAKEGFFDGFHVEALLAKKDGRWAVLEHGIGSTDVWWEGIEERHPGAPRSIFPHLDRR